MGSHVDLAHSVQALILRSLGVHGILSTEIGSLKSEYEIADRRRPRFSLEFSEVKLPSETERP
jgi:hypothetical protein